MQLIMSPMTGKITHMTTYVWTCGLAWSTWP
jgi:hypothetical protein